MGEITQSQHEEEIHVLCFLKNQTQEDDEGYYNSNNNIEYFVSGRNGVNNNNDNVNGSMKVTRICLLCPIFDIDETKEEEKRFAILSTVFMIIPILAISFVLLVVFLLTKCFRKGEVRRYQNTNYVDLEEEMKEMENRDDDDKEDSEDEDEEEEGVKKKVKTRGRSFSYLDSAYDTPTPKPKSLTDRIFKVFKNEDYKL